jgi:RNA polymerase sigma-70 factor (ECF subfamily)
MSTASVLSVEASPVTAPISDQRRLERMFRAHHELIWRTLRRLGLGPEAAADATQQAFLIAAERLDDIRRGSERAFLFGTALRLGRMAQRTSRRWKLEDDMDLRAGPAFRLEDLAEHRRAVEVMDRVLAHMDPDLITVFVLFELEGLSTPEIAKLVGIPVGTAASRLRRARETFRAAVSHLERSLGREVKS